MVAGLVDRGDDAVAAELVEEARIVERLLEEDVVAWDERDRDFGVVPGGGNWFPPSINQMAMSKSGGAVPPGCSPGGRKPAFLQQVRGRPGLFASSRQF